MVNDKLDVHVTGSISGDFCHFCAFNLLGDIMTSILN